MWQEIFQQIPPSDLLLERKQIRLFKREDLLSDLPIPFDPIETREKLKECSGGQIIVLDVGGTSHRAYRIGNLEGTLVYQGDVVRPGCHDKGSGVMKFFDNVITIASREGLAIGLSMAGIFNGQKLVNSANLPIFVSDLQKRNGGNMGDLFDGVKWIHGNDAVMLLTAALTLQPEIEEMIGLVVGSGVGGAKFDHNEIQPIEPGHRELIAKLNLHHQTTTCSVNNVGVCIEAATAGVAISSLFKQQRGIEATGEEISDLALHGDFLPQQLYANSARLAACTIMGIADAFGLPLDGLPVVCHGGTFNAPNYFNWVRQVLEQRHHVHPRLIPQSSRYIANCCESLASNGCIAGAAVMALTMSQN